MYFYCMTACLCMTTLTEVFPCFFLSCKANARVIPAKTGHGPHSFKFFCCSMYFLCYSMHFLCCSMWCLFCDVPCIVCVYMCAEQLPAGGYPIAVKYIIYHIISLHTVSAQQTTTWVLLNVMTYTHAYISVCVRVFISEVGVGWLEHYS
jgi:hypothetical protein